MKQENLGEVLVRISKNRTETHVQSFVELMNKILIFADSRNQIVSQLGLELLGPEQRSAY